LLLLGCHLRSTLLLLSCFVSCLLLCFLLHAQPPLALLLSFQRLLVLGRLLGCCCSHDGCCCSRVGQACSVDACGQQIQIVQGS
jgi:hypothetical protein